MAARNRPPPMNKAWRRSRDACPCRPERRARSGRASRTPKTGCAKPEPDGGKETPCVDEPPRAEEEAQAEEAASETDPAAAEADGGNEAPSSDEQPPDQPTEQFDDLLFPTQKEFGAIKTGSKDAEKAGQPEQADAASKADGTAPADALPDVKYRGGQPSNPGRTRDQH